MWSCCDQIKKLWQFQSLFDEFISIFGNFKHICMSMGFSIEMAYFVLFSQIKGHCMQIKTYNGLKQL